MTHNQKAGLKLLAATLIFGMVIGYLGAQWQIAAQRENRKAIQNYDFSNKGKQK